VSKITTTVLLCDHPGHVWEEPAVVTRKFAVGRVRYETDLCEPDSAAMTAALARFTAVARPGRRPGKGPSRPAESRRRSKQIRVWWGEHQRLVPAVRWTDRGRIPASVVAEYERRHGGAR
jgi:Lsr2